MAQNINNSIVSHSEVEALKEMIFKRAKERAEAVSREAAASYTTTIKEDVMELARNSFVAPKNPFSLGHAEQKNEKNENKNENVKNTNGLGFERKTYNNIKHDISAKSEIYSTMAEARVNLDKKSSFVGALNFLNNKAVVAALKDKEHKLNTLA